MSGLLYITADCIDPNTGAGKVCFNESEALKSLGSCDVWERNALTEGMKQGMSDPWLWDDIAVNGRDFFVNPPVLAHFYSGTFSKTVAALKRNGCKVTYTCAAHDIAVSRREHRRCGLPYNYPHLTEPELWRRYSQGYRDADVLICPSRHSEKTLRDQGCTQRIEVIPHGVDLPERIAPLPDRFTVGYLGAVGPDKGLIYLLQAWRKLNWKDAFLLIAGRDTLSPFMYSLLERFGGGNVILSGWLPTIGDFYNRISCYAQPSASEGFGIEVLEAMAHGRPTIASDGCGAADVLPNMHRFKACSVDALCDVLQQARKVTTPVQKLKCCNQMRSIAERYTWPLIREKYIAVWKDLLGER